MPQPQSLLAEMRSLEARRAQGGLSPPEEARLGELQSLVGPARPPPAPRGGFDVNAAAAAIRDALAPAGQRPPAAPLDLGALGPATPPGPAAEPDAVGLDSAEIVEGVEAALDPVADAGYPSGFDLPSPQPEPPQGPVEMQGYDEAPSFDPSQAPSLEAAPGEAREAQAAEAAASAPPLAEPALEQPPAEPGAAPWDPAAYAAQGYDPNALPADPNAAQVWDPDAAAQWDPAAYAAQGYDPNALPADPNAAQAWDPGAAAQWDPAAYAAQGYDPSALPADPNAPQAWDPHAAATGEPGAAPAGAEPPAAAPAEAAAPDQPVKGSDTASWDLGTPPRPQPVPAESDPGRTAVWEPAAATGVPGAQAEEDFRHDPPLGWSGDEGEELLDHLELVSAGSFAPIDQTVLPDVPVELAPVPPAGAEPALHPQPLAGPPAQDVFAIADRAASAVAASPMPTFELPPVTAAEEAILEVGDDVQEVPATGDGDGEPMDLVDEVTRPVPELAQLLPEDVPHAAAAAAPEPEPAPSALPSEEVAIEEQVALDEEAPANLAPGAEPPTRETAPSPLSIPPPAEVPAAAGIEPISLDAIGIEEAAFAPPPATVVGLHRVVVHTVEGQVKRGTLQDPVLDAHLLELLQQGGPPEMLPVERVRAIFFMLGTGEASPAPAGRKVRVTFRDGRQVAGFSVDYDPAAVGFFVVPADTRTNTARIWVYRSALRQVAVSDA